MTPRAEQPGTLAQCIIMLRGGGDIATGVVVRLHRAGFRNLVVLEQPRPLAVRRAVCLSEAVYQKQYTVEEVTGIGVEQSQETPALQHLLPLWQQGFVPVLVDPHGLAVAHLQPHVLIDATLSKRNIGVTLEDAPLVLGLGPGFTAGGDVHAIVETNRGPNLGRVITKGRAEPNTGIPASVNGMTFQRVLRAPCAGVFYTNLDLGDHVNQGQTVGYVNPAMASVTGCDVPDILGVSDLPVVSTLTGMVRGLLRTGVTVPKGMKLGDIEPREHVAYNQISDKALAIGGGVLEAVLARFLV